VDKRIRHALITAGLLIAIAWVVASLRFESAHSKNLYSLAVVSVIIVDALLFAEALGVALPVIEVLFGMIAGWLGARATESLEPLALMGGSAIMFLVGLEVDVSSVKDNLKDSIAVGLAAFAAPLLASSLVLAAMGYTARIALLVGVALSATSVAVVYAIVRAVGAERSPLGQVALSSAMVAEIASIVASAALLVEASLGLVLYIVGLVAAPFILAWLLRGLPALGYEAEVKIIIALLLAVTLISEAVGIHAVLASFILGLALQEFAREPPVRDKVEAVVMGFLAPVFFVTAGMNASTVSPGETLLLALAFLALTYPVQILVTWAVFKNLLGQAPRGLVASFGAKLTLSILIAYVGFKGGFLQPRVAGAIMLSAVLATLASGLLARPSEPLA